MKPHRFILLSFLVVFASFNAKAQLLTSVNDGSFLSPLTWDCTCIPAATNDILISTGDSVFLISNTTVNNLIVQSGGKLDNNGNRIDINGNYTIDGEHTGNGAIRMHGLNAVLDGKGIISNGNNFDIRNNGMSIRDTATLKKTGGGSFRLRGAITFTNHGYFESTRSITRNNVGALWHNTSGATVVAGNVFMANGQINASDPNNTVVYNRLANQNVRVPVSSQYDKLIIRGTGNKTLAGSVIINNNLELEGGSFRVNANNVELRGDFVSTGGLLVEGSGEFLFSGVSNQSINALAEETFYDFRINKAGGSLLINQDVVVSNVLTMTNGVIDARLKPLTLGIGTGSIGSLVHSSGQIRGTFSRWINNGTTTYLYPLGDGTNYLPAQLNFTTVVNGRLNGRFSSVFAGNMGLPLIDGSDSIFNTFPEGIWRFSDTSGVSGSVFNIQITANGFSSYTIDQSTRLLFRSNSSSDWSINGSHANAASPVVFRNGLNSLPAELALGDTSKCLLPSPATSSIAGANTVCKNTLNSVYSVSNTSGSTYFWSISGGSQISGGNTNSIQVNWGNSGITGSVQVMEYNGCEYGVPVIKTVEIQPKDPVFINGQDIGYDETTGNVYYIDEAPGYTYNWTVSGAGIRSGSGSNDSILVNFPTSGTAQIEVYLRNGCGNSDTLIKEVPVISAIKSVQSGNWTSASTWDCNCNPGNASSVQIRPTHTVTSAANGERVYAVIIESGGTLTITGNQLIITNLLSNQGSLSGSGQVRMDQSGSLITGNGIWTGHSGVLRFQAGTHTVNSNVTIQKTGNIVLNNNSSIINYGSIITNGAISGTNSAYWEQKENSNLQIGNFNWTNGDFLASENGNNVVYSATGNFTRNIRAPNSGQYYNLTVIGNAVGSVYRLNGGDIEVLGDLSIQGGTLDASATNFNIDIEGSWLNTGAVFNPRNARVSFVGDNQVIQHSTRENFYDLSISNSGTVSSFCELEIRNDLIVEPGSILDMNSTSNYELNVMGDLTNDGGINLYDNELLLDGGTLQSVNGDLTAYNITVDNAGGVDINSGLINVRNILNIPAGQLDTKNNMVFISNATETALLTDMTGGGSIVGDVRVQRYLDEGFGWYLLTSPVAGSDIEDWNTEIYMSGIPGGDGPAGGFISVRSYTENARNPSGAKDEGFTFPSSTAVGLGAGEGYFVYYQLVKPGILTNTLDINGPLFTGSYSTGTLSHTANGTLDDRGWHIVGNPYASPVDFSLLTTSNLTNSTAYVKRAGGNYWDIVNDNIDYLYSSEAMWLKVNPGGGSITFNENDKAIVSDDYNTRKSNKPEFKQPLKMILTSPKFQGYSDYSVIRFGGDSNSVNFDPVYGESVKLPNSFRYYPNVSSYSVPDSVDVYYNTLNPLDSNQIIPIKVFTADPSNSSVNYSIEFSGIEDWYLNNHCLVLSDSLNNVQQKIDNVNKSYSFSMMDTLKLPKLFLIHSRPLDTKIEEISCFGKNNGSISVKGSGSGSHNYVWYDGLGNVIKKDSNHLGFNGLTNLSSGKYKVMVSDNGVCGEVWQEFVIQEKQEVLSQFESPNEMALRGDSIEFKNNSENAGSYEWDFGDGIQSSKTSPKHKYMNEGTYNVTLKAKQNEDCFAISTKTINVIDYTGLPEMKSSNIFCYSFDNVIYLRSTLDQREILKVTIYNELGQQLLEKNYQNNNVQEEIRLNRKTGIVYVRLEKISAGQVEQYSQKFLIR